MLVHVLGLILTLLPTYLIRFTVWGLPTTALEILLAGFLLATVVRFNTKDLILKITQLGPINYAIGLFVLSGLIGTIISPEPLRALGQLKSLIIEPILFFYAALLIIKTPRDLTIVLRWLLLSSLVISLFGLIQYFTHLGLPLRFWGNGLEPKRVVSVFEYPNALALYLAPLLVFFVALVSRTTRGALDIKSAPYILGLSLMTLALYFTQSRGAWLAVLVGLGFLAFKILSWKKALIGSVLFLIILLLVSPIRERVSAIAQDPSSVAHLDIMRVGVDKIIGNPLLGNGLYGFRTTLQQAGYTGEILNYPHNIILNFWLELGVLGLLAFFLIIRLALEQYKKNPSPVGFAAVCFLLVLIIHGLVDVPYFKNDLAVLFWFTIALFYLKDQTTFAKIVSK